METLYLLLLAHVLGDFPFQTETISSAKCQGRPAGYLSHFIILVSVSLLLTLARLSARTLLAIFAISVVHIAIDAIKNIGVENRKADKELLFFILDQALHIMVIVIGTLYLASRSPAREVFSGWFYHGRLMLPAGRQDTLILSLTVYAYSIFGGAVLVRKVLDLDWARLPREDASSERHIEAGKFIGMVERAIITLFVADNAYGAVGFVLAAKSIARFRELENRDFAEYYLVGTLTSSAIAVGAGFLLKAIQALSSLP
ncbi:MAG: DUF3307 domain-containing protein [Firmicutes bacterium]|nr:DUF3307 domain-containing protein [Bacillota bacterium]